MARYLELGNVPAEFLPKAVDPNVMKELQKIKIYKPNVIQPAPKPYPIMTTPALVVDEQVLVSGRMPSQEELRGWLQPR